MKYLVNRETKEHRIFNVDGVDDSLNAEVSVSMIPKWVVVDADSEGWIPWSGGECPLPDDAVVAIKFINGKEQHPVPARIWTWGNSSGERGSYSIAAYRPILTEQSEFKTSNEWKPIPNDDDLPKTITVYGGGGPSVFDRLQSAVRASSEIPSIIAEIDAMLKPAGFCVARIPQEEPAPQPVEDMSDWRNWREGDFVRLKDGVQEGITFKQGIEYIVSYVGLNGYGLLANRGSNVIYIESRVNDFCFHSRPTGTSK